MLADELAGGKKVTAPLNHFLSRGNTHNSTPRWSIKRYV